MAGATHTYEENLAAAEQHLARALSEARCRGVSAAADRPPPIAAAAPPRSEPMRGGP